MNSPEPVVALVVAAGSGVRLGGAAPKALREVAGEPLISHAIRRLAQAGVARVVVILRAEDEALMREALAAHHRESVAEIEFAHGGAERQDSVRLGLETVRRRWPTTQSVLVHDAARPFVDADTIGRVITAVTAGHAAVVPAVPVVDTIRQLDGDSSHGLDRSQLVAVQTPQGFALDLLWRAHQEVLQRSLSVTDDAGACEAIGHHVTVVTGSATGFKITEPYDMVRAEAVIGAAKEAS